MNIVSFFKDLTKTQLIIIAFLLLILGLMLVILFQNVKNNNSSKVLPTPQVYPSIIASPMPTEFVPEQLIVKYKEGKTPEEITDLAEKRKMEEIFDKAGVLSQEKMGKNDSFLKNYYLVKLKPGTKVEDAVNLFKQLEEVENVQPNYVYKTLE